MIPTTNRRPDPDPFSPRESRLLQRDEVADYSQQLERWQPRETADLLEKVIRARHPNHMLVLKAVLKSRLISVWRELSPNSIFYEEATFQLVASSSLKCALRMAEKFLRVQNSASDRAKLADTCVKGLHRRFLAVTRKSGLPTYNSDLLRAAIDYTFPDSFYGHLQVISDVLESDRCREAVQRAALRRLMGMPEPNIPDLFMEEFESGLLRRMRDENETIAAMACFVLFTKCDRTESPLFLSELAVTEHQAVRIIAEYELVENDPSVFRDAQEYVSLWLKDSDPDCKFVFLRAISIVSRGTTSDAYRSLSTIISNTSSPNQLRLLLATFATHETLAELFLKLRAEVFEKWSANGRVGDSEFQQVLCQFNLKQPSRDRASVQAILRNLLRSPDRNDQLAALLYLDIEAAKECFSQLITISRRLDEYPPIRRLATLFAGAALLDEPYDPCPERAEVRRYLEFVQSNNYGGLGGWAEAGLKIKEVSDSLDSLRFKAYTDEIVVIKTESEVKAEESKEPVVPEQVRESWLKGFVTWVVERFSKRKR